MTITGLAPDEITAADVRFDLFKQALGDERLDHLVSCTALESGWQGQRQQGRPPGCGAEHDELRIGELGHWWMAPSGLSEPAGIAGCYGPEPRVTREAKERMAMRSR